MIIRSRRKNESLFLRFFGRRKTSSMPEAYGILTPTELELELAKEAARSSRRESDPEFVLISVFSATKTPLFESDQFAELIHLFRQRLRISDVIAASATQLFVLLPETNADGGATVANELVKVAEGLGLKLDSEFKVFPEDDDVSSQADEWRVETGESVAGPHFQHECAPDGVIDGQGEDVASAMLAKRPDLGVPFSQPVPTPLWKRAVDVCGSLFGLTLLSPVFVGAALAIKMDSGGPVFFKQMREGKDGEPFAIWKFRTMCNDAEQQKDELRSESEQDGPAFKLEQDPRITRVGRYLRKTCIDELPQLINVLRGEMSLVGPRPLPVNESYGCTIWQRNRLRALPGLTCIWQVDGGREIKFEEWMRMDLEYLRKRSFWFDLKLIFRTAIVAIMHRGSV